MNDLHDDDGALSSEGASPSHAGSTLRDLPAWLWLGVPALLLAFRVLAPLLGHETWKTLSTGELGALELGTIALLTPGVVLSILIFRRRRSLPRLVGPLMLLGGVCVLYFLGEEASWGQHYLGFETPPAIAAGNEQGEFNLHNRGSELLDNVPRQAMLVATFVGGIVLPIALRRRLRRPQAPRSPWYWIIPNYRLIPVAALAAFGAGPEKYYELTESPPPEGTYISMVFVEEAGEYKEVGFAGVMTLYLASVYVRARSVSSSARERPERAES